MKSHHHGDNGFSNNYEGTSFPKSHSLFQSLGDLDELNAQLGLIKASCQEAKLSQKIEILQQTILDISSHIATQPESKRAKKLTPITKDHLSFVEKWMSALLKEITLEPVFILPGDNLSSAHADLARAVCRRAERSLVHFMSEEKREDLRLCQRWVNRLSDLLFVLARFL